MPISREQLRNALAGARNVIQNDPISTPMPANARMQEGAGRRYSNNSGVQYVEKDTELSYDDPYGSETLYESEQPMQYNQSIINNSRIPDDIKKSMMTEQIDTSVLQEGSVLDNIGVPKRQTGLQQRRVINENIGRGADIDYSLIKKIIEEVIEEKLGDYSLKTIKVGDGNIRLVDHAGRIFTAALEYKGTVADKKKK